jgi:hypothetical protein
VVVASLFLDGLVATGLDPTWRPSLRAVALTWGAWPAAARLEGDGAIVAGGCDSPHLVLGLGGDNWRLMACVAIAELLPTTPVG